MMCSSSLADDLEPLVVDASVLINLRACTFGEQILTALPNNIAVPDIVVRELGRRSRQTVDESQFLEQLIMHQVVQPVVLDDAGWVVFENLTSGRRSLGDGEAATIAIATTGTYRPVIDDAKGRTQAEGLIPQRSAAWTLDLLVHPSVQNVLGGAGLIEALFLALRDGRMRIDEERCDAVVELIGVERALNCPSLPRFKARRELWNRPEPDYP